MEEVSLIDMKDRWSWSLDGDGEFSVASVRKMIDDRLLPVVSSKTRWINVVPIKVNILAWKIRLDCLPTRLNLSNRDIDIESILCPICDKEVESSRHIFFSCQFATEIFTQISRWWDVNNSEISFYEEWLDWLLNSRLQSKRRKLLDGVCYVMWWFLWNFPYDIYAILSTIDIDMRTEKVKSLADLEHKNLKDLKQKCKVRWALEETNHNIPSFSSNLFKQLSPEENLLVMPFSLKLIKKHWNLLVNNIVSYVIDFHQSAYIPRGCKSSFITLVHKVDDPIILGNFRPISLIGCQYKIIAKILANRLGLVLPSIIGEAQMAFIKGRQIIDAPLMVNEIISWAKKCMKKLLLFKVDFEKAFDTLINGSATKEFKLERELRQGDPLSHFLFIIAVKALNVVLLKARNNNIFIGVEVGVDKVPFPTYFADDALYIGHWSITNARNLSSILTCFYLASNFNKSKLYGIEVHTNEPNSFALEIGCQHSQLPFIYLGLLVGANMSRCTHWSPLVKRFRNWLSNWKCKTLSY
ncbi:putative RNA-directed DNA polymerase, eukaryota, reverse transcriptase zinc-binding domain protein [Tanacetum coccineum]